MLILVDPEKTKLTMTSFSRSTSRLTHSRRSRLATKRHPQVSMGLASVVLSSLWKLWRQQKLAGSLDHLFISFDVSGSARTKVLPCMATFPTVPKFPVQNLMLGNRSELRYGLSIPT